MKSESTDLVGRPHPAAEKLLEHMEKEEESSMTAVNVDLQLGKRGGGVIQRFDSLSRDLLINTD